jgi:hypothetical protein
MGHWASLAGVHPSAAVGQQLASLLGAVYVTKMRISIKAWSHNPPVRCILKHLPVSLWVLNHMVTPSTTVPFAASTVRQTTFQ